MQTEEQKAEYRRKLDAEQKARTAFESRVQACRPLWAKAAVVAQLEADRCDIQTDYFATATLRTVVLGWSKHNRDLFAEMRKAAATFAETAHLGPGKDRWTAELILTEAVESDTGWYYEGNRSPWHREQTRTFETEAEARAYIAAQTVPPELHFQNGKAVHFAWRVGFESIEHREKYSMGAGYYLKAGDGYGSGWTVSKAAGSLPFPADLSRVEKV